MVNKAVNNEMFTTTQFEHAKVLLVDDNADLLTLISIRLKQFNFEIKTARSAEEALSINSLWRPDLIITDLQMSGLSGMELFEHIQARDPLIPVIILTAHGTIPDAVDAAQAGVAAYLTKPFESAVLIEKIQSALASSHYSENHRQDAYNARSWQANIVTKSPLMESLFNQMEQLSDSRLVFFRGEPGTEKDQLAQAMYRLGKRADQQFAQFNCISLPQNLLEIEIFGRTGSGSLENPEKMGLLQKAHNGTLILNEANEANIDLSMRVVQALHDGSACTVDSHHTYPTDTVCIATINNKQGYDKPYDFIWSMRKRLDMATLDVPPLRDRREDIPLLVSEYLNEYNGTNNDETARSEVQFSNKAMTRLLEAEWPGNVRHLKNVIMQCIRFTKTKVISEALVTSPLQMQPLSFAHQNFERDYLTELLKITSGNVTRAADIAKRNRTEFHRLLRKHGIQAKSFRQ